MKENKLLSTRNLAIMAMLGALAGTLMIFEVPLPFIAPPFYGLDFSEIPVLIGSFILGPIAGVLIETVKILVKLMLKPTSTGFVGELANFCIGCALILPAGIIYRWKRTKHGALAGMAVGTVCMAAAGAVMNALVMLPFYSHMMPLETIISAGAAINPVIKDSWSFVWVCVAPFNLVKGVSVPVVTLLMYKHVSVLVRNFQSAPTGKRKPLVSNK